MLGIRIELGWLLAKITAFPAVLPPDSAKVILKKVKEKQNEKKTIKEPLTLFSTGEAQTLKLSCV